MNSESSHVSPVVVIVGVTASGKSSLAIEIAKKYNGEIICADSRTVYRGMDIGTAKPSVTDRSDIVHHTLDLVDPDDVFTAADFKSRAVNLIGDIVARGRLPIIVGGTGLYIDGLIFDFAFLPPGDGDEREHLQSLSVEQLQSKITNMGIDMPLNKQNPRHLIRAIETNGAIPVKRAMRKNTLVIGIDIDQAVATERISDRVEYMIAAGLETEVRGLVGRYDWSAPGMSAVGYREWRGYLGGEDITVDEVATVIKRNTVQYARRQRTWFRRNKSIVWIGKVSEADYLVNKFLKNHQ